MKLVLIIVAGFVLSSCSNFQKDSNKSYNAQDSNTHQIDTRDEKSMTLRSTDSINGDSIEKISAEKKVGNSCDSLDTSINGKIFFNNGESMRKTFPNLDSAWKLTDRVYFISRDSSRFISLGTNYGGGKDEYKEAIIGYVVGDLREFIPDEVMNSPFNPNKLTSSSFPKFYFTNSIFTDFKTQTGIKLGLSEQQFLRITRNLKLTKERKGKKIIYSYWNEYCLYKATYTFEKNLLVYFSFGYVTP